MGSLNGDAVHIDGNLSDARLRDKGRLGHLTLGSLLVHLALDAVVDCVENVLNGDTRLVSGFSAILVDAGLDQNTVPVIVGNLVDSVGASNVTLGSVTNKVNSVGRSNKAVLSLSPLTHQTGSKLKGRHLRLAESMGVQDTIATSEVLESNLEHTTEGTHSKTNVLVSSGPNNIVMGEVEGRTLVVGLATGAEAATLGHGNVEHDLNITSPVARVGEDEDGVNDNVCEIAVSGVAALLVSELAERSGGSVVLDNVTRGHDILEAVALSNMAALLTLASDNKHGSVLLSHLSHGSVATDELTRLDIALELAGEIIASLLFSLTTTVGEEDVRPITRCVSIMFNTQAEITMPVIMWSSPE